MAMNETMRLELPGADLKGFKLGGKVTATISGKLIELEDPRKDEFPDGEKFEIPPGIGIEVIGKATLVPKKKKNAFTEMANEDEGD